MSWSCFRSIEKKKYPRRVSENRGRTLQGHAIYPLRKGILRVCGHVSLYVGPAHYWLPPNLKQWITVNAYRWNRLSLTPAHLWRFMCIFNFLVMVSVYHVQSGWCGLPKNPGRRHWPQSSHVPPRSEGWPRSRVQTQSHSWQEDCRGRPSQKCHPIWF